MSRNAKPRKTAPASPRQKTRGGMLIGLFIGLVIGVLCAAGVVWYIQKTPLPFAAKESKPAAPPTATAAADRPGAASGNGNGSAPGPLPLAGKPGDPAPAGDGKPRFDFYKILPGDAEAIPGPKPGDPKKDAKPGEAGKDKNDLLKDPVYLQAGAFQNAGDADTQKAKLALMGIESSVQQVMLQDKVWYRVRLGPFRKMDELNATRSDLAKQGVDVNVMKKD